VKREKGGRRIVRGDHEFLELCHTTEGRAHRWARDALEDHLNHDRNSAMSDFASAEFMLSNARET